MDISTMHIGIVGASGTMGSALLTRMLNAGFQVHAFDVNPGTVHDPKYHGTTLHVHESLQAAVKASDIILLAVPYPAERHIAGVLADYADKKIVVSITNPLSDTLDDVVTTHDESAAEGLASLLPQSITVKAFNTLSAAAFDVQQNGKPLFDTFIATDHPEAARIVERIINSIGFRAWYVGGLSMSRTLERMSAMLIGISKRYELQGALGWRIVQETPDRGRG